MNFRLSKIWNGFDLIDWTFVGSICGGHCFWWRVAIICNVVYSVFAEYNENNQWNEFANWVDKVCGRVEIMN